jgi:hypothetical protein
MLKSLLNRLTTIGLCSAILLASASARIDSAEPDPLLSPSQTAIVVLTGVAAAGAAVFAVLRNRQLDKEHGGQVIATAESIYVAGWRFYEWQEYRRAVELFGYADARGNEYYRYAAKLHHPLAFTHDTLRGLMADCALLDSLRPDIMQAEAAASRFPVNPDSFVLVDKFALQDTLRKYRAAVKDLLTAHPRQMQIILDCYRRSLAIFARADSLFFQVYPVEKQTFELKSRFYYNEAIAALPRDSSKLKAFCADCGFYKSTNPSCQKAHDVLFPHPPRIAEATAARAPEAQRSSPVQRHPEKPNPDEVRQAEFNEAMETRRIELLEAYLQKYSSPKKLAQAARIDEIRAIYETRKKEIEEERAYQWSHPRFTQGDFSHLRFRISGIPADVQADFRIALDSIRYEFMSIPAMRFPASVTADYSTKPAIIMLDAFVHVKHDIELTVDSASEDVATVPGMVPAMRFLQRYKCLAIQSIERYLRRQGVDSAAAVRRIDTLASANYIVRLWKDNRTYLTCYARDVKASAGPCADAHGELYDFIDITVEDSHDIRISGQKGNALVISRSLPVSSETELLRKFFELW